MMSGRNKAAMLGRRDTELNTALADCRSAFGSVAIFGTAINLLMLASPIFMLQVYDRVLNTGHLDTLLFLTGAAVVALLVLGLLDALRATIAVRSASWLSRRLGPIFLTGGVRARVFGDTAGSQPMRDLAQVQSFISSPAFPVFFDVPWVPVFCVLIWLLHPVLGTLAICSAILLLAIGALNEALTRRQAQTASIAQISANQEADAIIRNAEVVRAMGMMPALEMRWRQKSDMALDALDEAGVYGGVLLGFTKFLRLGVQIAVLALGAWLVIGGELTGGSMIAASILLGRALAPVEQGIGAWKSFTNARLSYGRLQARLRSFPPEQSRTRLPTPLGCVTFTDVAYTAPGGREPVLRNINLSIRPGEAVAVIGPSASGKSTLCRLLVGILSPTVGAVRLDGSEMRHWDPVQLGQAVGYLPQEVELFAGTVRENIGRMGEQIEDEAVVAAALLAHAHDMVQMLPTGYETQIGEGGARLSGGQRQRLGLARAVYGRPKLIVLDEPNANLDQVGESALAAAVKELKAAGVALVIVGHRPSTLAEADKIILLKDGRIELFGPREEVLQRLRGNAQKVSRGEPPRQDAQATIQFPGPPAQAAADRAIASANDESRGQAATEEAASGGTT